MQSTIERQKLLAKYIAYHDHEHSAGYNTTESIITSSDIKDDLVKVTQLLQLDYVFLSYHTGNNIVEFLEQFALHLIRGTRIFCSIDLPVHPILFDQIMRIREHNTFNMLNNEFDRTGWSTKDIASESRLFLIFKQEKNEKIHTMIDELSDHILDVRSSIN